MNVKPYLQLLLMASFSVAAMPFRGTIQTTAGTPINGAKVVAISNRVATVSNSEGQFGDGGTSIVTGDVGTFSIAKPLLQKKAFYFNATSGQDYSYRLIDARGRAIVELSGKAEANGMQMLSLSNQMLADGFYINILQVGDKKEVFKSVITGNRTARPQMKNENNVHSARAAVTSAPDVSLVDTLYFSAKGYKNKIVPVTDTGDVGLITLEPADSDPEISCTKMFMGYTPENFPFSEIVGPFRGDTVILGMDLANYGASNALSVKCSLSTTDSKITIIEPTAGFNNIVQGDTMPQLNYFKVLIPRELPEGYQTSFKLHISDSWGGTWEDAYVYMPYPFVITQQKFDTDSWGYSSLGKKVSLKKYPYVEYTPQVKNVSNRTMENLTATILTEAYSSVKYHSKQNVGTLLHGGATVTDEDFVMLSLWESAVPQTQGDLLVQESGAGEYYLVPLNLLEVKPVPEMPNAKIEAVDMSLEYCDGYYPMLRKERVLLRTRLTNVGTEQAYSVSCSLATSDSRITIVEPLVAYDNLAPGDTVKPLGYRSLDSLYLWHYDSVYNPVHEVGIPRDFPAGESIVFEVHIKDSWGGSWLDTITYMPYPFTIYAAVVDDDQTPDSDGNGDGIVNLGEIIEYTPQLQNLSGKTVTNVVALFTESASYDVRDSDDKWNYGDFTPEQKQLPELDYVFTVKSEEALFGGLYQNDLLLTATFDGREQNFLVPVNLASESFGIPYVEVQGDTSVDANIPCKLLAFGSDVNGTIEKYVWAYDGVNYNDTTLVNSIEYTFTKTGSFPILVKVIDNDGKESVPKTITVKARTKYFSKSYPFLTVYDYNTSFDLINDSGYVIQGWSGAEGITSLIRVDAFGDTLWTKKYPDTYYGGAVAALDDGNIIMGVETKSKGIALVKVGDQGEVFWEKEYFAQNNFVSTDIKVLSDGGFILTGSQNRDQSLFVMRTDFKGDTLWHKQYEQFTDQRGYGIETVDDDGFLLCGYTSEDFNRDLWILRLNASGDTLWTKTYGDMGDNSNLIEGFEISALPSGDFVVTGTTLDSVTMKNDLYIAFFSQDGTLQNYKRYGGEEHEYGRGILVQPDGLYISGTTASYGAGNYDIWLLKTDSAGDTLWTKTYGDYDNQGARGIKKSLYNGLAILSDHNPTLLHADLEGKIY